MDEVSGGRVKRHYVLTGASLVAGLLLWQGLSFVLPSIVSSPVEVAATAVASFESGSLVANGLYSIVRVLVGFTAALVLAIPAGFMLSWYDTPRSLLDPWIQIFRMIPPIALIPLVIIYFGIGEVAKVFVIFFASFLLMLITVYQGTRLVDPSWIRAARVLGANDRTLFLRVILPASVPSILTAMRLGIATAWTTLVAAELVAASHGLGYMILQASQYFQMPTVYLGIVVIGFVGYGMDRLVLLLDRKLAYWRETV